MCALTRRSLNMSTGSTTVFNSSVSITSVYRRRMTFTARIKIRCVSLPYVRPMRAELKKRDWSDDRVHGRGGIGVKLLYWENLPAELQRRNYSAADMGKILGGNLLRVLRQVLPENQIRINPACWGRKYLNGVANLMIENRIFDLRPGQLAIFDAMRCSAAAPRRAFRSAS